MHGVATVDALGLSVNLPLVIEMIHEYQKIEPLLSEVKFIVGVNGVVTMEEVQVF